MLKYAILSTKKRSIGIKNGRKQHEREVLQNAGFVIEKVLDNPDGATIIVTRKGD